MSAARGVSQLLADFGHQVPTMPPKVRPPREAGLFQSVPSRGHRRRDAGFAPATPPVPVWRMTAEQAGVLWPFVAGPGLPSTGAQMGIDYFSRSSFFADPMGWTLDDDIPVHNPNVFVFGKPGSGKSGTVKMFIDRMMAFGYRAFIPGDVKDEYETLARALGVEPIVLGVGLSARVNPLSLGPLGQGWAGLRAEQAKERAAIIFSRWLSLVRGLVGSQRIGDRQVPFGPTEEAVTEHALRILTGFSTGATELHETTIPRLWALLDSPPDDLVSTCRYASQRQFLDETRLLRDALGQMVHGSLRGLFDDYTNIELDWLAPIQTLSLSRLQGLGDEAVGTALLCMSSWARGMRELAEPGDMRIVVRDESWKQLRLGPDAVKSFDADLRLSRNDGDVQFALAHKPSDLLSAGDAGSQAVAIARDMLHLADTKIIHGLDAEVAHDLQSLLGLPDKAVRIVTGWAKRKPGRALWVVGERMFQVETVRHPLEYDLTWTNSAIEKAA